jgi:hypothetical protein
MAVISRYASHHAVAVIKLLDDGHTKRQHDNAKQVPMASLGKQVYILLRHDHPGVIGEQRLDLINLVQVV